MTSTETTIPVLLPGSADTSSTMTISMTSTESVIDQPNLIAEQFYRKNGSELKVLMAMSMGLKNMYSNRFIFDEATEVLKSLNVSENEYTPNEETVSAEVARRMANDGTLPHIYSWDMDCCSSYLTRYPVSDSKDIAFIKKTIQEGVIKPLFHNRFYFPKSQRYRMNKSRAAMDSFLQAVSDLWNNPNFNPYTSPCPRAHERYAESVSLDFAQVANLQPVTPKMIEVIFEEMHTMLMDPYHCSYCEDKEKNQERKQKFLGQFPPYILYVWEFLVEHELQRSFLHRVMFFQPEIKRKRKRPHEDALKSLSDSLCRFTQLFLEQERRREAEAKEREARREAEAKEREAEAKEREARREARHLKRRERKSIEELVLRLKNRLMRRKQELANIEKELGRGSVCPTEKSCLEQSFKTLEVECKEIENEILQGESAAYERRIEEIMLS